MAAMLSKVEQSKFTVRPCGGRIVYPGGFDFVVEVTHVDALPFESDRNLPLSAAGAPRNALESGGLVFRKLAPVVAVLSASGDAQVDPSVVEAVSVDMINVSALCAAKNETVKVNPAALTSNHRRIRRRVDVSTLNLNNVPAKAFGQTGVGVVNFSKIALRKRKFRHGMSLLNGPNLVKRGAAPCVLPEIK
jgi:hypothetical protein